MSPHDDDVGGEPCHIDRRPSGLVSRWPFAPRGRSGLSDLVLPISTFPPRDATTHVDVQLCHDNTLSVGVRLVGVQASSKHYRGRCGRDAIRIEHQGRTRGFRFSFSFYRRGIGYASVIPVRITPYFLGSTATVPSSYQKLPSIIVSSRRSLRDLTAVAYSAWWLGVSSTRSQLSAHEAWGVDKDGGTDAPTHLRVTPRREYSALPFWYAFLISTSQ